MGVSDQTTTTIPQRRMKQQQQHSQVSPDSSRSVSIVQNERPSSSSSSSTSIIAKPRKRLTNSRSIIKRRLDQRPLRGESDSHHPQSKFHHIDTNSSSSSLGSIKIARTRKKLSKSASFIRPVGARTTSFTKCSNLKSRQDNDSTTYFSKSTCSSKFRSTLFPDGDEPQLLEMEASKVCPYTYCSLHGVGRSPQLKRFGSIRRSASRTYNSKPKVHFRQLQNKPSQVVRVRDDEHMPSKSNTTTNIQMANTTQGESMDIHISNQHQHLQDIHSNSCSHISEPPKATEGEKPREENEKTTRVWRLIYHSMLSAKYRSELYPEVNSDKQEQGIAAPARVNTSEVRSTETLASMPIFESSQMDAVKLVEDAIDELFIPEIEEQLSNNQTITSRGASERDLHESKLNDFSCIVNHCPVEEVKPFSKVGSESMSKNWSKLKQVVLLKRFVKALDKISELKFKEPQILNVEANPEMEKVSLRHQTTDEKRLADEWMLDYALRQAVAKLTPARRKKVELLIEAFETVIPLSKNGTPQSHNESLSIYTVSSCRPSTEKTELSSVPFKEVNQESITIITDTEHIVQKPSLVSTKDTLELGGGVASALSLDHPHLLTVCSPKRKLTKVASGVLDKFVSNTHTFDKLEHSLQDQLSTGPTGLYDDGLVEHTETKSIPSSVSSFDSRYDNTEATKMTKIPSELNNETVQKDLLMSDSAMQREFDVQLDNQKYFKMWGMIYNHVVSGSAAKIGSELHIIEPMDSREATDSKLDAVKLVEDALDEMLFAEYEDQSSDNQSITSDQDHLERVDSESGDSEISTLKDSGSFYFEDFKQMKAKTPVEACRKACAATHTEEPNMADKRVSKINKLRTNGWSNLKKFILLKRFIRALDKLKKFNPREPNSLSLEPDQEPEKISLKRQTTVDRLSAEQWMIDNAIQQVVARLTPARKRRVELLVEAFETVEAVLPLPNTRTPLKLSFPSAAHAKHF